jgi:hypothetical protein
MMRGDYIGPYYNLGTTELFAAQWLLYLRITVTQKHRILPAMSECYSYNTNCKLCVKTDCFLLEAGTQFSK